MTGAAVTGLLVGLALATAGLAWLRSGFLKQLHLEKERKHAVVNSLTTELASTNAENTHIKTQLEDLKTRLESAVQDNKFAQTSHTETLLQKNNALAELREELSSKAATMAALQAQTTANQNHHKVQLALLEEAKETLSQQFQTIASKLFDEKTERFDKHSRTQLEHMLTPFKEQLNHFRKRVDELHSTDSKERTELTSQLKQLHTLNQQLSSDAEHLTKALTGHQKTQGSWGELVLEQLLSDSGLREGEEYEREVALKGEDGSTYRPDVILHLPDNKSLIIDAKVSITAYERYVAASAVSDKEAMASYLKEHLLSVKNHIKLLGKKNYDQLPDITTIDVTFLFMAVEPAFILAVQNEPELFRQALQNDIVLVCPSTLMATLRTIEYIWRNERQNKNVQKIVDAAGNLYDKFTGFAVDLENVGVAIQKANEAQLSAMNKLSSGRGNLVRRVEELKKLGVRGKKQLSKDLLDNTNNTNNANNAIEIE